MEHKMGVREIVELVDACGKRVCTAEQHFGCPYWDNNDACVDRLQDDYDAAIVTLLQLPEQVTALQNRLSDALKYIPHCCEICAHKRGGGLCAMLPEGDEFSADNTEGFDRDDCEHWELQEAKR